MSTITSANAVVLLAVGNVFPVPQVLEKFSMDSNFTSEAMKLTENRLGVDGEIAKGKIFSLVPVTITLMPDSPSINFFNIVSQYIILQDTVDVTLVITLLSTGYVYTLRKGGLTDWKIIPDGKKVLEPQEAKIEFPSKYITVVGF